MGFLCIRTQKHCQEWTDSGKDKRVGYPLDPNEIRTKLNVGSTKIAANFVGPMSDLLQVF